MIIEISEDKKMIRFEITPETQKEWDMIENENGIKPKIINNISDEKLSIFIGDTEPEGKMYHGLKFYYHKPIIKKEN